MRIIAGEFRGRVLKAPKGEGTRPTTDRVREAMMSVVNSARGGFEGSVVLDAFAGSGALGFEAISRGASCVHFYERAGEALRALNANAKTLALDSRHVQVHRADVLKEVPSYVQPPFDLVFLDPPYAYTAVDVLDFVMALNRRAALSQDVLIVYEHAKATSNEVDQAVQERDLSIAQRKKYGDTVVDIVRCVAPPDVV